MAGEGAVRRATGGDAAELTRLRIVMFEGMGQDVSGLDEGWRLEWMREAGVGTVDLHASPDGEPLYRSLGFTEPGQPALTLRL